MVEDTKIRLCRRLKNSRKAKHLTLEQLGVAIGLDESSASTRISRYENGIHNIEPHTLERIAIVLDLPIAYFYADSEPLAHLIVLLAKLPIEHQQAVLDQLSKQIENNILPIPFPN